MTSSLSLESLKPHLLPLTAVMVVIATVPLAILPWSSQILEDFDILSQKSQLRDSLVIKANELEQFDVTASRTLLEDVVEPALPAVADPAGALAVVELVAQEAQLVIASSSYTNTSVSSNAANSEAAAATGALNVETTLTLDGEYANIMNFIQRIEKITRVVNLDSIHLAKADPQKSGITASFEISAPYMPHPADLGPVETPFPQLTANETRVIDIVKTYSSSSYSPTNVQNITGKANPF